MAAFWMATTDPREWLPDTDETAEQFAAAIEACADDTIITLRNLLGQAVRLMAQVPSANQSEMGMEDWLDDALDLEGRAREAGVIR